MVFWSLKPALRAFEVKDERDRFPMYTTSTYFMMKKPDNGETSARIVTDGESMYDQLHRQPSSKMTPEARGWDPYPFWNRF